MFGKPYMATAAQNRAQESFVGQVTKKIMNEMSKLERERPRYGAYGSRAGIYRKVRSSHELSKFLQENKLWYSNWMIVIARLKVLLLQEEKDKRKEIIKNYRKEIMLQDTEQGREYYGNKFKGKCLWRPYRVYCCICRSKNHTIKECKVKVEERQERMINEENERKMKLEMAENGGFIQGKRELAQKRLKYDVICKNEWLKSFDDVFYKENEKIKFCQIEKCYIKTKRGEKIVKKGAIVPQALRGKLDLYLLELEDRGIIRRSTSDWRNPIRALIKPNGTIRLVLNFMALNDVCEKDPYELRNIREVINETQGSSFFTVIDLKDGFYSIEIDEDDKKKTAFEFDGRVYEWNSMPMGFKNSPQILQRVMTNICSKFLKKGVSVYMDDVVVYGRSRIEHDETLKGVLKEFRKHDLKINRDKLQFALGEVNLLGVTINGLQQSPNEVKKNEALTYPVPANLKELRRFLGLAGWFRPFLEKFAMFTVKMTNSLKNSNKTWKWTEEMDNEFKNLKERLKAMRAINLPDYNKEFVLKTDASNVGLGAVLLQENNGELLPVQWASKKLTPTEMRYGISEKEMLAIFWGIKKFDYDLRGRRFKLITDHKALENIRSKPVFLNNRINRWIEKIQEYDFSIEYQRPENLVGPDALSRIGEDNEKEKEIGVKGMKIMQGKINKHVMIQDGVEYWVNDNGRKREMPKIEIRRELVEKSHIEVNHRGADATYHNLKDTYYWVGMKKTVENVVRKCVICARYNRKNKGGSEFVTTRYMFEKIALDMIDLRSEGRYVLIAVDYFTRYVFGELIENKSAKTIVTVLRKWFEENAPDEIITDNGSEFISKEVREMLSSKGIDHRVVSVESHRSNGRVERVIRTIREGMLKCNITDINDKVNEVIKCYNKTYHSAIKQTPEEAVINNESTDLILFNSNVGSYGGRYVKRKREKFVQGQMVLISQSENIKGVVKEKSGRFMDEGVIVEIMNGDSYLVKKKDGRLVKKRHYDLKGCG